MARVNVEQYPEVQPLPRPPFDYQEIQANPSAFGGLVGAAEQRAGSEAVQGAGDLISAAVVRQNRFNQVASDNAFNQLQKGYFDLTFGDPNDLNKKGFYSMRGEDALRAYPNTTKSLDDLRTQIRNGLQNDAQRLEFDEASRRLQMFTMDSIGRHYDQQFNSYQFAVNEASERNQVTQIGAQYNDDTAFNNSLEEMKRAAVRKIQTQYGDNPDPQLVTAELNRVTNDAIRTRTLAWGANDPTVAMNWLKTKEGDVDPTTYKQLQTYLQGNSEKNEVNAAIERSFQPGGASTPTPTGGRAVNATWERMLATESGGRQFDANGQPLTSSKGAIGRAQVMPDTARKVAARHGFDYDEEVLKTDAGYNHMIGRAYFGDLVKQYGGDTTLASAAYNAGEERVNQWIAQNGDPRLGQISDAQWASQIPFAETKNYVFRTALPGSQTPPANLLSGSKSQGTLEAYAAAHGVMLPPDTPPPAGTVAAQPTDASGYPAIVEPHSITHGEYVAEHGGPPNPVPIHGTPYQPAQNAPSTGDRIVPPSGETQLSAPAVPPQYMSDMQTLQRAYQETANMDPEMREKVLQGVYLRIERANALMNQADLAQKKAKQEAAEASGNRIVTQLLKDPTKVNVDDIANDPNLDWRQKVELTHVVQSAIGIDDAKDVKTYGAGFWPLFQRVHAPEGDPNRITDPTELYKHAGPNGDLTVAGIDKLTSEIQGRRTPEGEAASEMKKQFLTNARSQITGTNEALHIRDPKGDELYLKFLAHALPAYDAGLKVGKTPAQMLDPDSKDYIGASIATFKRPMTVWVKDMLEGNDLPGGAPATTTTAPAGDLTTREGIVRAYTAGRINREEAASQLIAGGFARAPSPAPAAPPVASPRIPLPTQ